MRVNFYSIFKRNPDGSYSPTATIIFNGVTIRSDDNFFPGETVASLDIGYHAGRELDVTIHPDGTVELNGIY